MIVIGGYSAGEPLRDTPVFKWIRAEDTHGNRVVVQIPNPDASWSTEQIQTLKDYFLDLQRIAGIDHVYPDQVLSDADYGLIIQYPDKPSETLEDALARAPENADKWWRRACDSLFRLHKEKLEHGCVSLDSFVVVKDRIYLTNFGYAPLLKMGHAGALADVGPAGTAPEVSSRHEVTKGSDIYALAKAVAAWKPDFKQTDIYKEATQDNPQDRCKDVRKIQGELKSYLRPRMYKVSATADPRGAGMVTGGGEYKAGTEIQIEAKPKDGWRFDHWTVDLHGHENPAIVRVDRDKNIAAAFVEMPVSLRVEIKPKREAGLVYVDDSSVDDEMPEIEIKRGRKVKVSVKSTSKWKFTGWQGDASGTDTSVDITMDANKVVVANFRKIRKGDPPPPPPPIAKYGLGVKVKPRGAGIVTGGGTYYDDSTGKHSEAIIEAKPKRGYQFDRWEEDVPAGAKRDNPVTLTMDGNKTVVANFIKVTASTVKVTATIEPPRTGRVVGVGEYSKGASVSLKAEPVSLSIEFNRWEGDVPAPVRNDNPVHIRANRDMRVKACFIESATTAEETAIKRREHIMIVGSPVTICPFLILMTGLMLQWAGIIVTSGWFPFVCISGLMINGGVVLSRLILGSEELRKIAVEELAEEEFDEEEPDEDST